MKTNKQDLQNELDVMDSDLLFSKFFTYPCAIVLAVSLIGLLYTMQFKLAVLNTFFLIFTVLDISARQDKYNKRSKRIKALLKEKE